VVLHGPHDKNFRQNVAQAVLHELCDEIFGKNVAHIDSHGLFKKIFVEIVAQQKKIKILEIFKIF